MNPSGKNNKNFEEPTSSKNSKKGGALDKGKSKQDAKDEKEKKRRSSLTDSPLTSSSSSSASTASRDSDDVDTNKRKSVSPNSKASDNETEEISTSLATSKLADDSRQNINQEASDEDKNRKSKNKRKKKKKVIDEISPNFANINDNAREAGGKCGIGKSDEPQSERSQPNPSKASSPLLLNSGSWTVNPLAARQSAGERPAYSTATQLMGTNTVSSVNSRMSYLSSNFVNSAALLHTFSSPSNASKESRSEVTSKDGLLNSHSKFDYPKLLFSTGPQSDEMVNHVERDNVLNIFSNQNKHLQKFEHKWIRNLHQSITDGDYKSFLRKIRIIMVALCRKSAKYQELTIDQLVGFIIQEIVSHFYNDPEQTTILMALVSTRDVQKTCGAVDHGFCRIAQTILHYLSGQERRSLLTISTKRCGKTALHLAVTSGSMCQLEVLLNNYVSPNVLDRSGRAALHYAIERNNLEMVKLLMWYGADIALCPRNNFHHPPQMLSIYNLNATLLAAWLNQRINALHAKFQLWIKHLCGDILHIINPISNMHFVRFCTVKNVGNFQSQQECSLDLRGDFPKLLNQPNVRAILFMIPVFFHPSDSETSAESPQFMRAYFPDNISLSGKTLFGGSCISNTLLDPIFSPVHNSHIYAFTLPSKSLMEGSYKFEYNLKSTASAFGEHSVNYPIMALRVIVCRDVDKSKSKLE